MVTFKETAEEQLLRMIEGPQGPVKEPAASDPPPEAKGVPPMLKRIREGCSFVVRWIQWRLASWLHGPRGRDTVLSNLQLVSRSLWVLLAVLGAYVVVDLLLVQPQVQRYVPLQTNSQAATQSASLAAAREPLRPASNYMEVIGLRNPFTGAPLGLGSSFSKEAKKQKLEEKIQDLVLVGIDRGPNPAALLESKAQSRTVVVSAGDEISGMKVKKITSEGVLLSYEGEEFLLR